MGASGLKQLLVLDVRNLMVGPTGDIGDELTEAPVGIPPGQLPNGGEKIGV